MIHLLVVEDEPDLANLLVRWFAIAEEVEVRTRARSEFVSADDVQWANVVVADQMLPGEVGCEVLHRFSRERPEVRRVLWSAVTGVVCEAAEVVLAKPVSMAELESAIRGS